MQRSDIRAVGDLAGEATTVLTTLVRGMHADHDEFLRDRCHEAPFLPHATYHFVSSTVAPPLLGLIAGDHLCAPKVLRALASHGGSRSSRSLA